MTTNIGKNTIKCAVFDLDGTLLNTIKTINYYLNLALDGCGLGRVSEGDCMSFVGDGAVKLIERSLLSVGADKSCFDKVFEAYNSLYNASPYYLTEIYEGIPELLEELKGRGIKLCVLSNKPDFATRKTVERFFPHTFNITCGGVDGTPLKPSPDALLSILSELSVKPEETVYIGDSETDIMTAKNAGVALCLSVSWGFRTVDQLKEAGAVILVKSPIDISNYLL